MQTVAIVGNGRTRVYAPFGVPGIDTWTMNNHAMLWNRQPDAVFEMHPDVLSCDRYTQEYRDWLKREHPFPIYMHYAKPEIPASVDFPRECYPHSSFVQKGDRHLHYFFTTTPPYMLALALHLGYRRVELYGIDMENEERQAHRDSVFFWLGILGGRGVEIYIPEESALMDNWLYPINTPPPPKRRRV